MTTNSTQSLIGKRGTVRVGELIFPVTIKDVRSSFGRVDYLVSPVDGKGEQWKAADSVTVNN